jgi:hypothetical protein
METLAQLLAPTNLPSSALRIHGQDGAGDSVEAAAPTSARRPDRRIRVPLLLDSGGLGPRGRGARSRSHLRPARPPPPCVPASTSGSDLLMVAEVKDWGEGSGRKGREEGSGGSRAREWRARDAGSSLCARDRE